MKQLITTAVLLISMTAFAQVGINNTSPKATLDITAKTNGTKPEGLIIPQLTGDQIRAATTTTPTPVYGSNQKGLIIYATVADSAPAGATASITAPGYYYFDGSAWQKIATGNTLNTSLANGNILVGNASNVATAVIPTGDVAISNTGATSIGAGKVTTTHLANNAVTVAKLPTGATATTFLRGDGTWVTPTDTNTTYTGSTSIGLNGTSFERAALTGDVTASANNNATTIAANAVTTSKIANNAVTVAKLPTGATATTFLRGDGTWVTPTDTNTTYTGSTSIGLNGTSFERAALTGDVTASANSNATTIAANAVNSAKIADGTVANGDLANMAAFTVKGNATNAAASPTDIAAGTDGYVLRRSGTTLGFGTVDTAGITDGAVTTNKILNGTVANVDLASGTGGIYNGNGTLSGNTTVTQGDKTLAFTSSPTLGTSHFTVDGSTFSVDAINNKVGIGTTAPNATLDVRTNPTSTTDPGTGMFGLGTTTATASTAGAGAMRYNTTSKDIQYSDGSNWSSLAKSDPYGGFVPVVKLVARKTSAQSIGTNTTATITFPTVVSNPDGAYNASSGIYTIPSGESGLYMISGAFNVSPNNYNNAFDIKGNFNGVNVIMYNLSNLQNTNVDIGGSVAYYMTAGQKISIASQTCNGCAATSYTYNSGVFSITKLSAN
jgi:hypothetical protein